MKISISNEVKKPDYLLLIEKNFNEIRKGSNPKTHLNSIARILCTNLDLNDVSIHITKNTTGKFFGMHVYPERSIYENLVNSLVNPKAALKIEDVWKKNKGWVIEIDSLLFDKGLNLNAPEMVAILNHEIGHIMLSNTIPQRLLRVVKYNILKLDLKYRQALMKYPFNRLLDINIIDACSIVNFIPTPSSIGTEMRADNYAYKMGYGMELNRALDKIIVRYGNSGINRTQKDIENELKTTANWTITNIELLEMRRTKLKNQLDLEININPSEYSKGVFKFLKKAFFEDDFITNRFEKKNADILKEQFIINSYRQVVVQEGFLDKLKIVKKMRKITQTDVYVIRMEIEKIESSDDKIYVIDKIVSLLDDVNLAIHLCNSGKADKVSQSVQSLMPIKDELEKMRQEVINIKISPKKYGVFIQYPKGYEG